MKRFAMSNFVWGIVCAGILALSACGPVAAADNDPAMLQSDKAFVQALASHDQAAVSKVLDKDFIWTNAAGETCIQSPGAFRIAPADDGRRKRR